MGCHRASRQADRRCVDLAREPRGAALSSLSHPLCLPFQTSPGTLSGSQQRAQRRLQQDAARARAEEALQAWQQLQAAGAEPILVVQPAESAENLPTPKISRTVTTRSLDPIRPPTLLQPKATQDQVAAAYGIDWKDLHAAYTRQKRPTTTAGADGRQLGTDFEQGLLADYADACGATRIAQTRADLAQLLRGLLESRQQLGAEGKPVPPLNHRELAFLRDESGRGQPSDEFWHYFEARYGLKLADGREQELSRSIHYTEEACEKHFLALRATLKAMGYICAEGKHKGKILKECEWWR